MLRDWSDGASGETSDVQVVWGSNPEPIKSPTRCQRLALAATLMCGAKPRRWAPLTREPERVLSEYKKRFDFFLIFLT